MADSPLMSRDLHGLIRLAGMCIAIPVEAIREVVPCPTRLDPFPPTRADVIGAMELRGQVIPVIDLGGALGTGVGTSIEVHPIVVILRMADKVLGVLAEAIDGVCSLPAEAIGLLTITDAGAKGGSGLLRANFNTTVRRGVVLDIAALAALPGLPLTEDRIGSQATLQTGHEPTLMFTVGGLHCGLPASCVAASLPWQELAEAPVNDPLWIAMLHYKGVEIPAVDTLALLGHGALPAGRRSGSSIVVRAGTREGGEPGLIALLIDSVDDIVRLASEQIQPLLHTEIPGSALARGIVRRGDGPCLMIDSQRLIDDPRLVSLSGIEQRPDDISELRLATKGPLEHSETQATTAERKPYLVFTLGTAPFAVPLDAVEAILPYGQDLVPLPDGGCGLEGMFAYRGQAVPLIDLARCIDTPLDDEVNPESGFIVVTREDFGDQIRRAGFRVGALCSVDRIAAQQIGSPRADGSAPIGLPGMTIRLATGRACPVLNLPDMAARIQPLAA